MTAGVVLCAFGEPPEPDREAVVEYLTRIFHANADLEGAADEAAARTRSRELAERRAPGLLEEYEAIDGSPLNAQTRAQADGLSTELDERGHDATVWVGMQFTEPFVGDAVEAAREAAVDRLVVLPVYPLCGPSTTVAAIREVRGVIDDAGWDVPVHAVSGWHRHPTYARLRAENVADFVAGRGVPLADDRTALVFSAHGTPRRYLDEGSRYERYVEEWCETVSGLLGTDYVVGYQNHANRDVEWTEPEVEAVVRNIDADRVVVEPVSFMHEQSETLSELDADLRADAEAVGLEFHRVPVPHDDPRVARLLADLVEPALAGFDPLNYGLRPCRCAAGEATCLNAP